MSAQHPRTDHSCERHRLAVGEVAAVDRCECGTIHLHVGGLTLRLTQRALEDLAHTLRHAAAQHRNPALTVLRGGDA